MGKVVSEAGNHRGAVVVSMEGDHFSPSESTEKDSLFFKTFLTKDTMLSGSTLECTRHNADLKLKAAEGNDIKALSAVKLPGGLRLVGIVETDGLPSPEEVAPQSKDIAIHHCRTTGDVQLVLNLGGELKTLKFD